MRTLSLSLATVALTACGPAIEVVDLSRDGALAFSTRADAAPVRTPCPSGYETSFPDEDYYTLEDGQQSVPLLVRFRDRSGLRRAVVAIPLGHGRPLGQPDLMPVRVRLSPDGGEEPAYVIEYLGEADGFPGAVDLLLLFEPGLTSGDGFYVEARNDRTPFRSRTRAFASVRRFGSVCHRPAG